MNTLNTIAPHASDCGCTTCKQKKQTQSLLRAQNEFEFERSSRKRRMIRNVQRKLNKVLGTRLTIDGIIGRYTRRALRRFQKSVGLRRTGRLTKRTYRALMSSTQKRRAPDRSPSKSVQLVAANANAVKQNAIRIANDQWNIWNLNGKKWERNRSVGRLLQDYWKTGARRNFSLRDLRRISFQEDHPWSAAFISWVMKKAGAGKAFRYSGAHAAYIKAAKENRLAGNSNPFKAYRISEIKPRVGDLVCKSRARSGANYDNIRVGHKTHCDIVTSVKPGKLITIGGNVGNSVSKTPVRINSSGYISQPEYFAVIRISDSSSPLTKSQAATVSQPQPSHSTQPPHSSSSNYGAVKVKKAGKLRKSFEPGVKTVSTSTFRRSSDPRDVILAAVSAAEGKYDTVNMYDRGILSWGISQWTVHAGSLQKMLYFVKKRLGELGKSGLWNKLFPGLDVRKVGTKPVLFYKGTPLNSKTALRRVLRGSPTRGQYNWSTITYWARIFGKAGRHPLMQQLQREYARKQVRDELRKNLGNLLYRMKTKHCSKKNKSSLWKKGICPSLKKAPDYYKRTYGRICDYVGGDLKASVLFMGMKVQNPSMAYLHLMKTIDRLGRMYNTKDISRWPSNWQSTFTSTLERVICSSRFAYWGDAKAKEAGRKTSRTRKILKNYNAVVTTKDTYNFKNPCTS